MTAADWIIVMVVVAIIIAAAIYIKREKKKGAKCIGCPAGGGCQYCRDKLQNKS